MQDSQCCIHSTPKSAQALAAEPSTTHTGCYPAAGPDLVTRWATALWLAVPATAEPRAAREMTPTHTSWLCPRAASPACRHPACPRPAKAPLPSRQVAAWPGARTCMPPQTPCHHAACQAASGVAHPQRICCHAARACMAGASNAPPHAPFGPQMAMLWLLKVGCLLQA
jgi:hypothetical protein